jgi:ribonuclease HI
MQDPRTRIYDPVNHWGNDYDQRDHICYVSGQNFVRARCDLHYICDCSELHDLVDLVPCNNCYTCENCQELSTHGHAIVIATEGACRNNGRPDAIAACGIFFNVDSYHNKAFKMKGHRPTSQRAELRAAVYALGTFTKMFIGGHFMDKGYVTEVIIKSDSAYLVSGMTSWIFAWRQNGWLNSNGHHLKNQGLFREIDRLCNNLVLMGVRARFWRVPREENQQADKLANAALDGTRWKHLSVDDWFGKDPQMPVVH